MASDAHAEIVITRRSIWRVAPEALIFEVNVRGFDASGPGAGEVYDDRYHDLYYFWDFGDPYTFTAPQNLPEPHKNANIAYGSVVSHTYRVPGRYTASLRVVEPSSGKQATANLDVAIGDPDIMFAGVGTVFVSPSSKWSAAPKGAARVTSLDAAVATIQGNDAAPRRIMLNRGEVYAFSGASLGHNPGLEWPSCHIVASPGQGEKPTVACKRGFFWNDQHTTGNGRDKDFVVQNVDWVGQFDSTSDTGNITDFIGTFENPPNLLLADGCYLSGFGHAIYNHGSATSNHRVTVLNDCTVTNFGMWGVADSHKAVLAITGSSLRAHVDALVDSTSNMGAPVRTGGNDRVNIILNSEFFSRQGWSGHGNYIATQPSLRLNSEGYQGARANVQANSFESGYDVVTFIRADGSTASAGNVVIEKNYVVGSYQTNSLIASHMGGLTVRNNVMVMPNALRLPTTNNPNAFVAIDNPDGNATNASSPVNVYNNTMINRCTADNYNWRPADPMPELAGADAFAAVSVENNLILQPYIDVPIVEDGPVTSSPVLWAPREKGYHSKSVPLQHQTATPPDTVGPYSPLEGSDALGDARHGSVAYDDFYGNQRPQYPSRGAFEMA